MQIGSYGIGMEIPGRATALRWTGRQMVALRSQPQARVGWPRTQRALPAAGAGDDNDLVVDVIDHDDILSGCG